MSSIRAVGILILAALLPACGISGGGTLNPTVAPGSPSNLIARAGNHSATLTWTAPAQDAGFTVLRALTPAGPFFPVPGNGQFRTPTTYVDSNLTNGTTYYYEVVSSNSFGQSAPSLVASTTPGFKAVSVSSGCDSNSAMALLQDGSVWTWGIGTTSDLPVQVSGIADVTAIACGANHFLALQSNGTVWAWGNDGDGQLGDGLPPHDSTSVPTPVVNLEGIVGIAAGGAFSLALRHDGTVWAWGFNDLGQLGTGSTTPASIPTPQAIPGLTDIVQVSAGGSHALALRSDGLMFAWGWDIYGELGNNSAPSTPLAPIEVPGLNGIVGVSAGNLHSLALRNDGTVWAWGYNVTDQVGPASLTGTVLVPTLVNTPPGAVGISAGTDHSLAILGDGTIWSWGGNSNGQLGIGTSGATLVATPTRVNTISSAVLAAAAGKSSVAMGKDGTVWTWGENLQGELGNGTGPVNEAPVQLMNFTGAIGVAGGAQHSVALKSSGSMWSWGVDSAGQFGVGATSNTPSNVLAQAGGITTGTALAAGAFHVIVLLSTGAVMGAGVNNAGELGIGTTSPTYVTTFTPVKTPAGITAIACGGDHGLAIRNDQTLWTWGYNVYGQLGNGSASTWNPTPAQLAGLSGVVSAAGGGIHSAAVLSDGSVWTWGNYAQGQLGLGVLAAPQLSPAKVPGISTAVAVVAGVYHTVVLLNDGTVWTWGDYVSSNVPIQVSGLTGVTALAAGLDFSLALRSDGSVWGWGTNDYGQIGSGAGSTSAMPVQVPGISGATSIAAGYYHSLAITSNQTVWCWGRNDGEQLGVPSVTMATSPVVVGN